MTTRSRKGPAIGGDRYASVRDRWEALRPAVRHYAQLPELAEAVDLYAPDAATRWVAAADGQATAGLVVRNAPVMGVPLRLVTAVSSTDVVPVEPVCAQGGAFPLLCELPGWDVARMRFLRHDSRWLADLPERLPGRVTEESSAGVGIVDLPDSREQWRAALSANMRSSLRKTRRKAEESGGLCLRRVDDPDDILTAYDRFVALETGGWKGEQGTSLAHADTARRVYGHVLASLATQGMASILAMSIGGVLAASALTVQVGATLCLLKIAYNEDFRSLSPFSILLEDEIERCCDDPTVRRVDFMAGAPWQSRWKARTEPTFEMLVFNGGTARGRSAHAAWRARQLGRQILGSRRDVRAGKETAS